MGESLITRRGGGGLGDYGWIKAFGPWNDTSLLEGYEKQTKNTANTITLIPDNWMSLDYNSSGDPSSATGKYDDVVAVVFFGGYVTFISGVQNEVDTRFDASGSTYPMKIKLASTGYTNYSTVQIYGYYSSKDYPSNIAIADAQYIIYTKPSQ